MLAAIGLLLIVKQIPFAFGIGGSAAQSFANWPGLPVAWAATATALASLALLVAWDTPALRALRWCARCRPRLQWSCWGSAPRSC